MRLGHQGKLKDNFGGDKREVVSETKLLSTALVY